MSPSLGSVEGESSHSSSSSSLHCHTSPTYSPNLLHSISYPRISRNGDLSILYYNAESLYPKMDELAFLCSLYNPKIICIVETWLSNDITDSEISIPGYAT